MCFLNCKTSIKLNKIVSDLLHHRISGVKPPVFQVGHPNCCNIHIRYIGVSILVLYRNLAAFL